MTYGVSCIQVPKLIEVNEGYVGESSLLAEQAVWMELLPFIRRGLTAAIVKHTYQKAKIYMQKARPIIY
jgi:hypothetical protein